MTQQPIKWYRGLQANLPLFGVDGSWYFCEDTGALFSSVGTALVQVAANLSAYATQAQVAIAVAVETARAEAAESTAITNAEAFATSAVATEANARTAAIAVETGRAETAEALLQPISGKGQANGYAGLNSAGQIPSSALPALAISETYVVSSQASMLALAADVGDIAVRTDVTLSFILQSTPASTLANWVQLLFPPANVLSVFGRTGAVGAMSGDYSAFYDAAGAAATAQATAESFTTSAVATEATARNTAIAVETTRAETAEVVAISTAETFATSAVATETSRAETAEALLVPKTTTVNTHALSGNVVISASDLTTGTLPHAQLPALVSGDIPNNAANTTGTSVNLSGTPALPNGTTATTQLALDSSTKLSTTSYVDLAVGVEKTRALAAEAVVLAAIPTSFAWNVEGNASGNLSLSNAAFTSTFNQTSAVVWLWANTAVATALTTNASPVLSRAANYWTGSASAPDTWAIGSSLAAGTNGASTLTIAHSGSTGYAQVSLASLTFPTGSANPCNICCPGQLTYGIEMVGSGSVAFVSNGNAYVAVGRSTTNEAIMLGTTGCYSWSSSSNPFSANADTTLSRISAGVVSIGVGAGDFSGTLKITTVQFAASSAAPTSAGTAGTFGQIIVFGGILYFCSVTGAAGSATWNKLSMTAV